MESEPQKTGPTETSQAAKELQTRPTLEDTQARLKQAFEDLATYASSLVPGMTWKWVNTDQYPSGCDAPFDQTAGRKYHMPDYVTQGGDTAHGGGIPDAVWPAYREKARQLAAELGATETDTFPFKEDVGDRQARFFGSNGTVLWIATRAIHGDTGCRLPAAEKSASASSAPTSESPK